MFASYLYSLFLRFSDDDSSRIEAILTNDNLLDGTIITNTEQFYVEPSERYSSELAKSGIHSIVYKLSDVQMKKSISNGTSTMVPLDSAQYCASERLHRKMQWNDFKRKRKLKHDVAGDGDDALDIYYKNSVSDSDVRLKNVNSKRSKRWLPDEVSILLLFLLLNCYVIIQRQRLVVAFFSFSCSVVN